MSTIDLLLKRRSVLARELRNPGPSEEQLQLILRAAHRVPDHGKIGPWRFIIFSGEARVSFGEVLREIYEEAYPSASEEQLALQEDVLLRAPVVIAVTSNPDVEHKIPVWEQTLSAGAACQNILLAATDLGFGAQWITEWYSYNEKVNRAMGLQENEKIAGFIYIGSFEKAPTERGRPALEDRVIYWK